MMIIFDYHKIVLSILLLTALGCGRYANTKSGADNHIVSLMVPSASFNWTMVNVDRESEGDAHLIQVKDGKTILIDTGSSYYATNDLIPYLRVSSVKQIDIVFITHGHSDHYGGLIPLIQNNISIGSVYFNIPSADQCNSESWGCNPADLFKIQQVLNDNNIPLYAGEAGMNFNLGIDTTSQILYAFNLDNSPVGYIDINDESLIILLQHQNYRFLFSGDLNENLGTYLAQYGQNLQADILKFPHHGTASLPPNSFFNKVNPQYAMVPSPQELWCSDRSSQARTWINGKNIPVYVNGFHGHEYIGVVNNELKFLTQYNVKNRDLCNEMP